MCKASARQPAIYHNFYRSKCLRAETEKCREKDKNKLPNELINCNKWRYEIYITVCQSVLILKAANVNIESSAIHQVELRNIKLSD